MKKIIYAIFTILTFSLFVNSVSALYGDLNYNITSFTVNDSGITIKGWAFVHRTQNYVRLDEVNGVPADRIDGKQTVAIKISGNQGNSLVVVKPIINNEGDHNYNFYGQMFTKKKYIILVKLNTNHMVQMVA